MALSAAAFAAKILRVMARVAGRTRGLACGVAIAGLAAACGGGGGGNTGSTSPAAVAVTTAPGAPTGLIATAGNASASIAFTAPASNGGSAITGYAVTCSAGASTQGASGATSPITVTPLTNNTAYTCTATAANAIGTSAASAAITVTPLSTIGAPGAPTLSSVTPANSSATLTFSAPASAGVSPITSYTAACTLGAARITMTAATVTPMLLLGLTNGSTYSCSVTAANAIGAGPASAALSVTPAASASTPAGVAQFTSIDFAALVSYTAPTLPAYYDATVTALDNTPPGNQISDRGAALGRVLFYDKRLSINDTIACASCHKQASGFTDPQRFSTGFSGTAFTTAHAMRLGNVRYYRPGDMFWDRRVASVEIQATQPVQNAVEMGWTAAAGGVPALITKMNATTYYPALFNLAFGTPLITETRMQQALAQFERAMISSSSRWDTGYAAVFNNAAPNANLGVDLPNFTVEENRGRLLFINARNAGGAGCAGCHVPPTFALAANSQSNGLDAGATTIFKSPSLKNLGVTGPYMHDGRFATLAEVVEFYDHGVQAGPSLDNRLKQGGAGGPPQVLNLSTADKAALVAFLRTLDDPVLNSDPRFASPMLQ